MSRSALRLLVILSASSYAISTHVVYANLISPLYAYDGLVYRPADDGSLPLAMVLAVLPSTWLPIAISRPSQVFLWMFYALAFVPSVLMPYYVLGTGFDGVFPLTVAILVSFGLLSLTQVVRIGRFPTPIATIRAFENLVFGIAVVLGMYIVFAFGLRLELPNVADVYDVRAAYDLAVADSRLPFVAYAVAWSAIVANPLAMLLGLRARRYVMFGTALAIEIILYGITGYKSALLMVAFIVPLYLLLAARRRPVAGLYLAIAPVAVILVSVAADQLLESSLVTSLFVRRTLMVPGQLLAVYFDFFSHNPTYALSHSILRFLGAGPYDLDPGHLIGAVYFHSPGLNANANVWADGLANFGFAGLFAATAGVGLVMILLDGAATGRDLQVTGTLAGLMAFPLSNSAFLTTILTHGLGLALLLVFLMPRLGERTEHDKPSVVQASPAGDDRPVVVPG